MENDLEKKLEFGNDSVYHLNTIWKWTLFLSIIGFIGVAFIFFLAIAIGPIIRHYGGAESIPYLPSMAFGVVYFFVGVVALIPVIFLFLFSTKAKKAIQQKDTYNLEQAFKNLKYHFVITGVLTIIGIGIYFLIGVIALVAAVLS
ncbi:MAG: hypothetical protein U9R60_07580 [Bacteroidota bacterium]|nr:hypothetical protein [Bacteroidota bacterium]